ncbi:Eco57I restriction-modification methylase domain-containing protein [Propionibacterium freudenreichii]|uniref:Eco57I restriction-modification methylase domain-containing protein n=1 Tax=Propionibacterium freudenreichii TaxID=1744 RepID=UPI00243412CB|nr:N-6 DNA methylase [Propionibacterium freudenreichii]
MSDDKLRGGFYSPDVLVDLCLARVSALLSPISKLRVLEPAAGDGAFLRGLHRSPLVQDVEHVEAVEINEADAAKAAEELSRLNLAGKVVHDNVLRWSTQAQSDYDLVLANPPYVRFQFISEEDKQRSRDIASQLGTAGNSVSNLWIPVFLISLAKLREGGVFSVILPTEFLTGVSASAVRNWLIQNSTDLTIDLFKPGSFPAVLQEVLILTGRRTARSSERVAAVQFHDHNGGTRSWSHMVAAGLGTWTSFLLLPDQHQALVDAQSLASVRPIGEAARFSVSTVTGANNYFCLDREQVKSYRLEQWAIPMLPRSRYAEGLVYGEQDAAKLDDDGRPAWMLSFAANKPSPIEHDGASRYLARGQSLEIDKRFKCRVRTPWYRVPVVPAGDLLLSKRSNRFPRVIANHAKVVTTDTIYRGLLLPSSSVTADDFTATFHNSLTLLSAEIEGRSFGGGVLELVPSEVASLRMPMMAGAGAELERLDRVARESSDPEALVVETDRLVAKLLPEVNDSLLESLGSARETLLRRRLERGHSQFY